MVKKDVRRILKENMAGYPRATSFKEQVFGAAIMLYDNSPRSLAPQPTCNAIVVHEGISIYELHTHTLALWLVQVSAIEFHMNIAL